MFLGAALTYDSMVEARQMMGRRHQAPSTAFAVGGCSLDWRRTYLVEEGNLRQVSLQELLQSQTE